MSKRKPRYFSRSYLRSSARLGLRQRLQAQLQRTLVRLSLSLSLSLLVVSAPAFSADKEATDAQKMARLAVDVRTSMGLDYKQTLSAYATPQARAKFESISAQVWTIQTPINGWSYFTSVSVPVIVNVDGAQPAIAFYHPWSDVFLVTAWEIVEDEFSMVDVELLPSDVVRSRSATLPSPLPMWLESEAPPPAAIGNAVGKSVNAFLSTYTQVQTLSEWKKQFASLQLNEKSDLLAYKIASHNLAMNLINIQNFWSVDTTENAELVDLRAAVIDLMVTATEEGFDSLVSAATQSDAYMDAIKSTISKAEISRLDVVYYMQAEKEAYVLLTPSGGQYFAFSLNMHRQEGHWLAAKVDVVPYVLMINSASQ